jgi:succinylglutamate desuccinylase
VDSGPVYERRIARYSGEAAGPTLLCLAGLHGNEPAGVLGLERVMRVLDRERPGMRGDFVGLAGNLAALECGRRFIDEDLNRVWQSVRVNAILASERAKQDQDQSLDSEQPPGAELLGLVGSSEYHEQRELLIALQRALDTARGTVFVLDLHTTSAESAPFATLGDTRANREFALKLPLPIVLGLEEQIDGAMLEYLDQIGLVGIGIEGGGHDASESVEAHEDSLWLALGALGMLEPEDIPDAAEHGTRLAHASKGLPQVLEVRYRHEIRSDEGFRMLPGFRNFEAVEGGQVVGSSNAGLVRAPESGRIFLPLYQEQGDDGFFIVHEVNPAWLRVSAVLRGFHVDRLAPLIPGVQRHPDRTDAFILGSRPSRVVIGLLHLLGFTKRIERGQVLMIRRAEHDE